MDIWRTDIYIYCIHLKASSQEHNDLPATLFANKFWSYQTPITMSSLTYVNEQGAGQKHSDLGHYSQAVIIGDIAKLAGQGGWDNDGNLDQYDWKQQIKNAFENIDRVLQAAGFRGWEDVSVAIVWHGPDPI